MIKFDHYLKYDELTDVCRGFAEKYRDIVKMSSIGKTYEGRDIWLLTISDPATGAPEDKPALIMDGNIHAIEVTSSMTVLYTLDALLCGYGNDEKITALLKNTTVYAIPRINADGAELCLTTPYNVRGSVEKFYEPTDGVTPQDINGDGEILEMRIPDSAGKWKISALDDRIMEERKPLDTEGQFYTIVPEGMVRGDDLINLKPALPQEGLDPNRQFPFEWSADTKGEGDRSVSGPEPMHDVEVKVMAEFVKNHANIVFEQNFHTYGGFHISPAAFCPHLNLPGQDADAMHAIGGALSGVTGYQSEGIFPPGARDIAKGSYTTWEYFELGIMAWCTELWNFHRQADPSRPGEWSMFFCTSKEQFDREQTTALAWDDERNGGRGFMPWTPFEHPQLGRVEIGGWREKFTKWNPPIEHLEGVCRKGCAAVVASLKILPRLGIEKITAKAIGEGEYEIEAAIINAGYLPTSATQQAVEKHIADDLTVTLTGAECVGESELNIGHIDGYSKARACFSVKANPGDTIELTAHASRAGYARAALII